MRNAMTPFSRNGFFLEPSLDRFFNRAFDVPVWNSGSDVEEHADRAVITLEVPGVKPEQISVKAEHRTLIISAEREGRSALNRRYTVGTQYDLSGADAKLELGVLTVTLPKAAEAQPREITIQVN